MPELSISTDAREPVVDILAKVHAAYEAGVRTLWVANHLFQRDPVTLAHAALARCPQLRVVLMAVNPFTQHPVQAAMSTATLDELYPGRVSLCLGAGAPADLQSVGIDGSKPLGLMREAMQLTRALFSGETVRFEGQSFQVRGRVLANGHHRIPLILAASGPQMLELAGASADGVLITAGSSVEFVQWSVEQVRRGAGERKVRVHGLAYGAIDDDAGMACARVRRTLGIVLRGPHHARNLALTGSELDQARLSKAVAENDTSTMDSLITDEIVRRHTLAGTAADIRVRLQAYQEAGLDEAVLAGAVDAQQVSRILQGVATERLWKASM
ncbi:LLM class flavin-dependent oxidoreductase [Ramlibacter tataouinensis]|uniref:LLM class flavin-dependent oxidoreductase n=1 Tax=Ramlibacter tataouinensis TaxID=94132 RepID=UPI0022F3CD28|nr:LLM class flavin-dependent oxidoreductase [Ramlibacter tataouinensis]WBY00548.1 LLM class flavin-dependent oxidoreductase [Ramlibacter tataouinensis]